LQATSLFVVAADPGIHVIILRLHMRALYIALPAMTRAPVSHSV